MYRDSATALDERDRAIGAILISEAMVDECDRAAQRIERWDATSEAERWRAVQDLQDIYPEIWCNLDRARGLLARRGANTVAYDELRPFAKRGATHSEGQTIEPTPHSLHGSAAHPGIAGVVDVDAIDSVKRALNELKLSVSGVDWKAIAARTAGLVREPLGNTGRRPAALIAILLAAVAMVAAIAAWFVGQTGNYKPTRAESLRRELAGIRYERKARIAFLRAELGDRCLPQPAHELIRLMALDGLRDDARALASSYTELCGDDPVIENWSRAPRPGG